MTLLDLPPLLRDEPAIASVLGRANAVLAVPEPARAITIAALILFGDQDPIFSRRAAEVMAELLPNAELDPPVEGAGHFLQEDRGELLGERIAAWLG